MEGLQVCISPEGSSRMKRRRSTSASPRRTSKGSTGNKRSGSESKESSATRQQKSKRRSSTRRSLLATLECIQSAESGKTEANPDNVSQPSAEQSGQTEASAIADVKSVNAPLNGEKLSLDSVVPPSKDFNFVPKLRAECIAWTEELNRYQQSQDDTPEFGISTNINTEEINGKYELWHEQINELEDKLSASFAVVNKTMQRIDELKTQHNVRVSKSSADIFNSALVECGGDDSKLLIKKIFMLHSMIEDR